MSWETVEAHRRCPPGKCIHKKKRKYPKKRRARGQIQYPKLKV